MNLKVLDLQNSRILAWKEKFAGATSSCHSSTQFESELLRIGGWSLVKQYRKGSMSKELICCKSELNAAS